MASGGGWGVSGHYDVFDLWVEWWRRHHSHGDVVVVRFADDIVLGFQKYEDAAAFRAALAARLSKFGLGLHPEKTRLLRFGRFAAKERRQRGHSKPETFDFLGLTHICGTSKNGRFVLLRHSAKRRLRARLREIRAELLRRRHMPVPVLGAWLHRVVSGFFRYHAVPTNATSLCAFRTEVTRAWLRALRRRSQRSRLTWMRMNRLADRWLPVPRVLHPWPEERFDARTRGRSPVR